MLKAGSAKITATAKDGSRKAGEFALTVTEAAEAKVTSVSAVANSSEITATGETVLTATPEKTGNPTITYTWAITAGSDYAEFAEASTGATITLKGKSTDTAEDHDVTVSVTASDGTNTTEAATVTVKVLKVGGTVTAKVESVSVTAEATNIAADGTTTLTATPVKSGEPTITYTWTITAGSDYAEFAEASTGATITLKGKSTDTAEDHDVTVSVTASDGTNTTEAATVTVTVAKVAPTPVADTVTKPTISSETTITGNAVSLAADGSITLKASAEGNNGNAVSYAWTVTDTDGVVTKAGENTATLTLTASNEAETAKTVTVSVKATAGTAEETSDAITITVAAEAWDGKATADNWNFVSNASLFNAVVVEANKTSASDGVTYTLSDDVAIKGADGVLTLTLSKAGTDSAVIADGSKSDPNYAVQAAATDTESKGLRFKYDSIKIARVKGKVVLSFDYKAAGTGERSIEVIAGTKQVWTATTTDSDKHETDVEIDAGSGTDIYITDNNNYWIEKITITENTAVFAESTNSDTENTLATLGLIGTSVTSSDDTIATATITDGKIAITSKASGTATLTVTDKNSKTATIAVTVKGSGEVEVGTITKFKREAPTAEVTKESEANKKDATGTVTWDALTDLEYSTDGETYQNAETAGLTVTVSGTTATITGLTAGTYYVRGSASDDYEATAAKSVTVTVEGAAIAWKVIGEDDATKATVAFTSKKATIAKNSGIYLPVSYAAGKKVVLSFTVDKDSVNADTGSKICGGFAFDDTFGNSTYAVFASNKGISNGSKVYSNGGSSNGYGNVASLSSIFTKADSNGQATSHTATSDVTFTVTFTIGAETASKETGDTGKVVVLNGKAETTYDTDNKSLELTKDVKAKEMVVKNSAGTVSTAAVPYIYFGSGATDSITVSNITLTVDDVAVATSAD